MDERVSSIEQRLDVVEQDLQKLRENVHAIKNEQQATNSQIALVLSKQDQILTFVEGTDKVLGFCRKHWRTLLKFGCGFVTAYGVTNPAIQRTLAFTAKFFGF